MVNKTLGSLFAGLFPDYCALCGLRSDQSMPLCRACEGELAANPLCCYQCAIPMPPTLGDSPRLLCGECLQSPPIFDRVIAPWLYSEQLAYLIKRWKFHGEQRLTPILASLWLRRGNEGCAIDVLVPVPLHWRRLWQRGFNQSELLCRQLRAMSPALAHARLDHHSLRRTRATPAQSGIGAAQRGANLRGAFTAPGRYDNLRIAVIDDVFTTGATASAMAATLRAAGAAHIEIWCLARTPGPGF